MAHDLHADPLPNILAESGLLPANLIQSLFTGRDRTIATLNDILSREFHRIDEQYWLEKMAEFVQNRLYNITEILRVAKPSDKQSVDPNKRKEPPQIIYIPVPGLQNADRIPHPQEDIYPGLEITRKGEEFHSRELAWKLPLTNTRYALIILNYDPWQVIERTYYSDQQHLVRAYWSKAASRHGWEITPRTPLIYFYTTLHQWLRALTDPPQQWTRMFVRKWAADTARENGIDLYAYTSLTAFGWSNISQQTIEKRGVQETYADRAYRARRALEQEFNRNVSLIVPLYRNDPGIEAPYKKELNPLEASARLTQEEAIALTYWENVIRTSVERGISDIHITPTVGEKGDETQVTVRTRLHGVLAHYTKIPEKIAKYFYSYVFRGTGKELGNTAALDDLRRSYVHPRTHKQVDLRISITAGILRYPQVAIRILDQERLPRSITQLKLNTRQTELFGEALNLVGGMLLVVGETGSGKTSTLYCALNSIRNHDPYRAITSIEDPVEYRLPFISHQVPIDPIRNITYPGAIRQTMRNDPDTVMVGEIRDLETANTALSLALSGHQTLSTLHANNCVDAISRLQNMGVDTDILSRVLRFVIAQRLVGIPCQHCCIYSQTHPAALKLNEQQKHRAIPLTEFKTTYLPFIANDIVNTHLDRWLELHPQIDRQGAWVAKGDGCPECSNIGYQGRRAVMEMLYLKDSDQSLIRQMQIEELQKRQTQRHLFDVSINTWELAWSGQTAVQDAEALTNKLEGHDK